MTSPTMRAGHLVADESRRPHNELLFVFATPGIWVRAPAPVYWPLSCLGKAPRRASYVSPSVNSG